MTLKRSLARPSRQPTWWIRARRRLAEMRRAARLIEKVVRSAVANAEQDVNVDVGSLYISKAVVDEGPLLGFRPRWRPISRGRAVPIRKRLSHIKVTLSTPEEIEVKESVE